MDIKEIEKKVNKMVIRERVLVLLTTLVAVYFVWDSFIYSSLFSSKEKKIKSATAIRRKITSMQTELDKVSAAIKINPVQNLKDDVTKLKNQNRELEGKISKLMEQLIPPKDMANLLGRLLAADDKLKLISIKNIPEVPLFVDTEAKDKEAVKKFQVYKHGLEVEFEGTYMDTLSFLKVIEKLKWKLLWGEFSYSVKAYPNAQVKLLIETLSADSSWIGI